jgi:hypothetical protein
MVAVADHELTAALVALIGQLDYIGVDFGLQRGSQHPPRTLADDLVDQGEEPLAVVPSSFTTLSTDVPSRPVLRTPVLPGDLSINHPGKVRPPRADPQVLSIARCRMSSRNSRSR